MVFLIVRSNKVGLIPGVAVTTELMDVPGRRLEPLDFTSWNEQQTAERDVFPVAQQRLKKTHHVTGARR